MPAFAGMSEGILQLPLPCKKNQLGAATWTEHRRVFKKAARIMLLIRQGYWD
jgi:hypothetical protein